MPPRKLLPVLLGSLAGAIFLGLSMTRRLNFDESLALRAGWLDLEGLASAPAFLMPWTLLAGGVGHLLSDPGAVLLTLRAVAAGAVAAAFWGAARAHGLSSSGLASAAWLALASSVFATHAIEFRYDAAVLVLLLLAYRVLASSGSAVSLGAICGVLSLHHLKGLFFGLGLAAVCLVLARERWPTSRRLVGGACATWAAWLLVVWRLGLTGRFGESLHDFYSLATQSSRVPPWDSMGPVLRRDLAWWLLVLVAITRGVLRRRNGEHPRGEAAALALAGLGVGFWIIHPHAWAYLAAIPVPFLAFAAASELEGGGRKLVAPFAAALVGLVIQVAGGSPLPLQNLRAAIDAPLAPEIDLLRTVHAHFVAGDRALDPSGVLYFIPPCTREWYVDTLYAEGVNRGTWMRDLAAGIPSRCTLALNTYRLGFLPANARTALGRDFQLLTNGLAVRHTRMLPDAWLSERGEGRVENFW